MRPPYHTILWVVLTHCLRCTSTVCRLNIVYSSKEIFVEPKLQVNLTGRRLQISKPKSTSGYHTQKWPSKSQEPYGIPTCMGLLHGVSYRARKPANKKGVVMKLGKRISSIRGSGALWTGLIMISQTVIKLFREMFISPLWGKPKGWYCTFVRLTDNQTKPCAQAGHNVV